MFIGHKSSSSAGDISLHVIHISDSLSAVVLENVYTCAVYFPVGELLSP
jgi:hypothetical protein